MDTVANTEFAWPWKLSVTQQVMVAIAIPIFWFLFIKFVNYRQVLIVCCRSLALFDSRVETFKKCNIKLKQDMYTLCESGLYYSGDGSTDKTTCFSCGIDLYKWEEHDDVWMQHALWSNNCTYLTLVKGKQFIEDVHRKLHERANDIPYPSRQK